MQFESESEDADFYQLEFGAPDQQDLPPLGQRSLPAPGQVIADAPVPAPGNEPPWPEDLWASEHFSRGPRPSNNPGHPGLESNDRMWALFDVSPLQSFLLVVSSWRPRLISYTVGFHLAPTPFLCLFQWQWRRGALTSAAQRLH